VNKVCDFTAQSGNGDLKVAQLTFENECLRQEVTELKNELSSLTDKTNSQSESISGLKSKIDEIKESYSTNLAQHTEQVTQQVEHQKELFSTAVGMYENWSIGISLFLAMGGLATLFFIKQYKTREVEEVVDSAVAKLNTKVEDESLLISAVVNAFDNDQVILKLDTIRSDMFDRQEVMLRTMLEDRIGSEESESFRDVFRSDSNIREE
jgi:cell division septum initiation protein DivIVA